MKSNEINIHKEIFQIILNISELDVYITLAFLLVSVYRSFAEIRLLWDKRTEILAKVLNSEKNM